MLEKIFGKWSPIYNDLRMMLNDFAIYLLHNLLVIAIKSYKNNNPDLPLYNAGPAP